MTTLRQAIGGEAPNKANFGEFINLKHVPFTNARRVVYCDACQCPVPDNDVARAAHNERMRH